MFLVVEEKLLTVTITVTVAATLIEVLLLLQLIKLHITRFIRSLRASFRIFFFSVEMKLSNSYVDNSTMMSKSKKGNKSSNNSVIKTNAERTIRDIHSMEYEDTANSTVAKNNLMALGIELDTELIERLQNNLGIEKIFTIASKTAKLIKKKAVIDIGSTQEMNFRHVDESVSIANTKVHEKFKNTIKPWQVEVNNNINQQSNSHETSHANHHNSTILRELSHNNFYIEPQYRMIIEKMIDVFRIQYLKAPERFICCLLDKRMNKTDKQNKNDFITRIILQHRYINQDEFQIIIGRIYPKISNNMNILKAFFHMLSEEKQFASTNVTRRIVDLWNFLSLLKTSSSQLRRSYDDKTSRVSNDVEFWNKSNCYNSQGNILSVTGTEDMPYFDKGRHGKYSKEQFEKVRGYGQHSKDDQYIDGRFHLTVAELLGQEDRDNERRQAQGRGVKGRFTAELGHCDVPSALNSPLKASTSKKDGNFFRPNTLMNESYNKTSVADALGAILDGEDKDYYNRLNNGLRPQSAPATRSKSASGRFCRPNTLINESKNKTSVAAALGSSRVQHYPPENASYHDGRYNLSSILLSESRNKTSVASALGCDREDGAPYNSPAKKRNGALATLKESIPYSSLKSNYVLE